MGAFDRSSDDDRVSLKLALPPTDFPARIQDPVGHPLMIAFAVIVGEEFKHSVTQ